MRESCYAVEQFKSQWVVSVGGTRILACKSKRMALKAARRATLLLLQNQQAEMFGRDGTEHGGGRSPAQPATAALPHSA